jgi:gluconate kinase
MFSFIVAMACEGVGCGLRYCSALDDYERDMVFESSRSHEMRYIAITGSRVAESANRMKCRKRVKV